MDLTRNMDNRQSFRLLSFVRAQLAFGMVPHDELLVFIAEDAGGEGLCLSMEMIMPFYSDDEAVMEEALLYSPVLQYGSLFIEENQQDGLLDLIYRLGFPLYPPVPIGRCSGKTVFDRCP